MKILVIGDCIIDHYVYGLVNRQSPEDVTIPVIDFIEEEYRLGGAANVAVNIKSLSKKLKDEVFISSIISDFTANMLKKKKVSYDSIVLSSKEKPHSAELIKTRIMHSDSLKQFLRLDNRMSFRSSDIQRYKNKCFYYNGEDFDAVVISDYNKGLINEFIIERLCSLECPIFVDTKNPDLKMWDKLIGKNVFFKVNQKEWSIIKNQKPEEKFKFVITNSEKGATLLLSNTVMNFPTEPVKNGSVIGAGDVFLSALVVKYLESEGDILQAIVYANKAARRSVEKFGISEVKRDEII